MKIYDVGFPDEFVCESFTRIYEKSKGMFSKICIKHILLDDILM